MYTEEQGDIPYEALAGYLFSRREGTEQEIIPFLGAGVSISARPSDSPAHGPPTLTKNTDIQNAIDLLRLDGTARLFFEMAAEVALLIQHTQSTSEVSEGVFAALEKLKKSEYPPSATDLVELLSRKAGYRSFTDLATQLTRRVHNDMDGTFQQAMVEMLRLVASRTGVPSAPLSSIAAYFEAVLTRPDLLRDLTDIFINKSKVTPTHQLLAQAARWHLCRHETKGHYLIVTTNYDRLMETALAAANLPFAVLTMNKKDFKIHSRFGGNMSPALKEAFEEQNPDRFSDHFTLQQPRLSEVPSADTALGHRLVIIHKIHGCLFEDREGADSIVISDNDYVLHISRMGINGGTIPSCVNDVMHLKKFLFLGYSLSDWNVRGILRAIRQKRGGEETHDDDYGDFAVVRTVTALDSAFFGQNKIRIVRTTLNTFASKIGVHSPQGYRIV